jgi:flavin reductase (DIM6/NTAB) family NADH-FMN oxidoreductase RutF
MKKNKVGAFDVYNSLTATLSSQGALLVAGHEIINPMTIGWGMIGIVWGKPVMAVLVRPSRYTHELLDNSQTFSVNVPTASLRDVCMLCGSKSGREVDKIAAAGLTIQPGRELDVPTLMDCPIHYECQIVHQNELNPASMMPEIGGAHYRSGDYHTVYWGVIAGAFKRA